MVNTAALEQIIEDSGIRKNFIAEKLGLSPQGFRLKETGKQEFKISEVRILKEVLHLTEEDVNRIFLPENLTKSQISGEGDTMEENKKEITKALLPVLQMTRNLWDLTDLEYREDEEVSGIEVVIATFRNGHRKVVDVTMDSGTALIKDIINGIV